MRKFTTSIVLLFFITLTSYASEEKFHIIPEIPMFSFEKPVTLKIKVIDRETSKIADKVRVIFEAIPGSSPPFNHHTEFSYYHEILKNNYDAPDVQKYIEYLKTFNGNRKRIYRKIAQYHPETGYFEATYLFDRAPYQIRAFIIDENGDVHNADVVYPHRAHCAYFDVLNIEIVKQYLHYVAQYAKRNDWKSVRKNVISLNETVTGNHGLYYMLKGHHGENTTYFENELAKFEERIAKKSTEEIIASVNSLLLFVQNGEDYFGTISICYDAEKQGTIIKVWDNTYDQGMTNAIVITQFDYSVIKEMENPCIIPLQRPNEGKYHAMLSFFPHGKHATEISGGEYFLKGIDLEKITTPTRIIVYYSLGSLEIPSKFITKELNVIE